MARRAEGGYTGAMGGEAPALDRDEIQLEYRRCVFAGLAAGLLVFAAAELVHPRIQHAMWLRGVRSGSPFAVPLLGLLLGLCRRRPREAVAALVAGGAASAVAYGFFSETLGDWFLKIILGVGNPWFKDPMPSELDSWAALGLGLGLAHRFRGPARLAACGLFCAAATPLWMALSWRLAYASGPFGSAVASALAWTGLGAMVGAIYGRLRQADDWAEFEARKDRELEAERAAGEIPHPNVTAGPERGPGPGARL